MANGTLNKRTMFSGQYVCLFFFENNKHNWYNRVVPTTRRSELLIFKPFKMFISMNEKCYNQCID